MCREIEQSPAFYQSAVIGTSRAYLVNSAINSKRGADACARAFRDCWRHLSSAAGVGRENQPSIDKIRADLLLLRARISAHNAIMRTVI